MASSAATRRAGLKTNLATELERVAVARLRELREIWAERLGYEPPPLRSREIFRHMLAYRLQAEVLGDLSAASKRKLAALEARRTGPGEKPRPSAVRLAIGSVLIREWKGVRHEVWVLADGFSHQGMTYKSLSEVARTIAGTRWNGPLFFGLRDNAGVGA